ncbi:hypothetical protein NECAME_17617 [Necator americanus]|uniref:Uncharacterized protein n=1 Tax=Necator americanus TaxID=51031 RepID=W2TP09_NECAM|nr:hypothetical protein NECAME_17617 [Necator americanus]ETN82861.1 hypothetical protein NECAME_17617 [Necator americanus]
MLVDAAVQIAGCRAQIDVVFERLVVAEQEAASRAGEARRARTAAQRREVTDAANPGAARSRWLRLHRWQRAGRIGILHLHRRIAECCDRTVGDAGAALPDPVENDAVDLLRVQQRHAGQRGVDRVVVDRLGQAARVGAVHLRECSVDAVRGQQLVGGRVIGARCEQQRELAVDRRSAADLQLRCSARTHLDAERATRALRVVAADRQRTDGATGGHCACRVDEVPTDRAEASERATRHGDVPAEARVGCRVGADRDCARIDRRRTREAAAVAGQRECAVALPDQASGADKRAREGRRIAGTEGQPARTDVDLRTGDARQILDRLIAGGGEVQRRARGGERHAAASPDGAAFADRQRAAADRRCAGVCVVAGQRRHARSRLGECAASRERRADTARLQREACRRRQAAVVHRAAHQRQAAILRLLRAAQVERAHRYRRRARSRTERAGTAEPQRAGADRRAAGVGIRAGQDQGAEVGLVDAAAAGQLRRDRVCIAGSGCGAVSDADQVAARRHRDRGALDQVAAGRELHAAGDDVAGRVVDAHRPGGGGEDRKRTARVRHVESTIGARPVVVAGGRLPRAAAAFDDAVILSVAASVPEVGGDASGVDQVHLCGYRSLNRGRDAGGQRAELETVIDQRAAIADDPRAAADRRAAAVGVRGGQHQRARIGLREFAGAGDHAAQCQRGAGIDVERPGTRTQRDCAAEVVVCCNLQCAGVDRGATGIGVHAAQYGRARADLLNLTGAGDHACFGHRRAGGWVEGERGVVGDVACDRAVRGAVAQLQGAGADRRAAGVNVCAGQHGGARADLLDLSGAGDHTGFGHRRARGGIEGEDGVVGDVACDRAVGGAVAQLQRAGADRRATRVGIRAGQDQGPEVVLVDAAAAGQLGRDRGHVAGSGRGAVADADYVAACSHRDLAALDEVAAGGELHAAGDDVAQTVVDGHRAGRRGEDRKRATRVGRVDRAVNGRPIVVASRGLPGAAVAIDCVVVLCTAAAPVPEIRDRPSRVDQVDLACDRSLDRARVAVGQRADCEAVVGQRAAVADDPVDSRIETGDRR